MLDNAMPLTILGSSSGYQSGAALLRHEFLASSDG